MRLVRIVRGQYLLLKVFGLVGSIYINFCRDVAGYVWVLDGDVASYVSTQLRISSAGGVA
jgi:hypothetical protein